MNETQQILSLLKCDLQHTKIFRLGTSGVSIKLFDRSGSLPMESGELACLVISGHKHDSIWTKIQDEIIWEIKNLKLLCGVTLTESKALKVG